MPRPDRGSRQPPMWTSSFQALDLRVELSVEDPALVGPLQGLTSSFGPPQPGPGLVYCLRSGRWPRLEREGRSLCIVEDPADLVPIFEFELYQQALSRLDESLALHAAALVGAEGALLICGASGAGKSTLTLALLEQGAGYLTDELSALDRQARVRGFTRPLTLRADNPLAARCSYPRLPSSCSAASCQSILVQPPRRCYRPVPLRQLVFVDYRPTAEPSICRLSEGETLSQLWQHALTPSPARLELAVRLAGCCPAHQLVTSGVEEACAALRQLWTPGPPSGDCEPNT